jgi:hypothetical protein
VRPAARTAGTVRFVSTPTSCSVCGRTILKGERTRTYLTPDGEDRIVCELCRSRAEALQWISAEDAAKNPPQRNRRRRGSLVGWLRGLAPRPATEEGSGPRQEVKRSGSVAPPGAERSNGEKASGPASGSPRSKATDPAARGARVGRAGAIAETGTRLERAMARFNGSEHARTVAGLTKTLGDPQVSVGAAAGSPNEIRITVAWELSWYQWGVDLGEPASSVYEIAKGYEVAEIDASAREWNAHVEQGGRIAQGTAAQRPQGEPARTES